MRIALSVDAIEPSPTGIGRYSLELARGLAKRPDIAELSYFRGADVVEDVENLLVPRDLPARSRLERWWRRRSDRTQFKAMRSSIVHAPNFFLPDWTERGVATIHDLSVFRFPGTHPEVRIRDFEARFDRTIARAGRIITGTNAIRQELIATLGIAPERIAVVGHGVHRSTLPADDRVKEIVNSLGLSFGKYCLCVATIEPRKRIGELMVAYAQLPMETRRQYPLVLVGKNGWLAEEIVARIDKAVAEGWLKWLGFASEPVLDALYFGAKLFIFPSLYEGFGLPPIEAMAHDVPVLISDDPSMVEVSGEAAMVVNADDPTDFAQSIQRGLEDDEWRRNAILRGRNVVASLTWNSTVEKTAAVYRSVL